ncbi:alpha-2-macroglobulin family protein [Rubrolithibacter danxiaensis]|uniref:alpha-2-macroglobulin family protein n=1 Tax=Rubrolithibacter danxiaensis TaxID=3390805 RepID=UPI003BF8A718
MQKLPAFIKGKPFILSFLAIAFISVLAFFLFKPEKEIEINPAFAKYIESYTSGTISKTATIRVQLTGEITALHKQNEPEEREIFDFEPTVKGKTYWLDSRTIEFRPDENLTPGKQYDASFNLGALTEVPEDLSSFDFKFQVIKPSFKVEHEGLKALNSSSLDLMKFTGVVYFADEEQPAKIAKLLSAEINNKSFHVKWSHNPEQRSSRFTIDSIPRSTKEQQLTISWDGDPLGADVKGKKIVKIPAIGVFKVLDIRAVQNEEQYALIQFSDPIMIAQDLNGLIGISTLNDLRFTITGSEVKVYSSDRMEGNYQVVVNEGIENISSKKLKTGVAANLNFEDFRPSVTIPGKGNILPSSGNLTLPFEAVNLKAVDVTIIKIYENNIPQYLQVNNMDGENDLRRVAKPIVQKTIRLEGKGVNLRKKNRFFLDINKILRTEPGAIYRVTIGFRKSYSVYPCNGVSTESESQDNNYDYGEQIDEDDDFWNLYNNYYPADYQWDEKDEPCSNSYYTKERWASRNIIASNIGLIAKRGTNNILIAATDILTTKPLNGVELKLLDYQQQVLATLTTNNEGLANFDLKRKPFMLIAKRGEQRGYLKLDDGSSLPLSRFNVNGEIIQKGIKGFIYGERGVWRPGDSLFISFILEDKEKKLPQADPVTFEFYTPQGQLYKSIIKTQSVNGFYSFHTVTEPSSPTGNWLAKIKVGGAVFQKSIKIETIMPNRLKIDLHFNGRKELVKGQSEKGILTARWLFGAAAQNLKAKVDVTLTPALSAFTGFAQYTFDDPTSSFEAENKTVFDGKLNADGTAAVNPEIEASNAPGVLKASFTTKVFEPGGNFSIDNFSIPYYSYLSYAGIHIPEGDKLTGMLLTDKNHPVNIVNVNAQGKLITGKRKVQVELYKIQWRWWWDQEEESLSNFTQNKYNQLLGKETIILNNGTGKWNLRINYPDWGRYLIRVKDLESGHTSGKTVYVDWPGWAQREQQNNPTEASMLSFTANKEKYSVGENITLTIPSSKGGRGLISIESGSKVIKTWWIETTQGQTRFSFKAEKGMAPNVFVNVTLLQPHANTVNDLPIRMYGVIPLLIEDKETILKPVITMPDIIRPETRSALTVSENSGKAMTYTIAIVDEGLLDLTRFKTPDPHASFYAKEALGVKTWDLFDNVIGAWGGDLERILSIGGDANINRNINPAKSNRFKPVVKFLGPFHLNKGEKKSHSFILPKYIGSVRAMLIAGENGAYGYTEKAVAVKKPLMLLATLPRVAGPGESFKLPVTVFAMENSIKNVSIDISANNMLTVANQKQTLSFSQTGEKLVFADVKVKNTTGIAKIKIVAKSGSNREEYNLELDIRNPNPYITSVSGTELEANKTWNTTITPIGMPGTNSTTIEVSSIPPVNLTKRLNYLIQYPHGCVEQITSAAFPQLYLKQLTDLSEQQKVSVERNIKNAISRLRGFQTPEGGLSYWPGNSEADEWGTNYAGHFVIEAQNKGYSVPAGFLDSWKRYQKNRSVSWVPNSADFYRGDLIQAYRLYLLALAKSPEIGAMNRLREFKYLSAESKWRLASAYKLVGRPEIATQLIKGLSFTIKPYSEPGKTFGSELRDQAMILETLVELEQNTAASKLLYTVAAKLSQEQWYSTQTTAYALIAIAKYCGENESGKKLTFSYSVNGSGKTISSDTYLYRIPVNMKSNTASIKLSNQGKNRLYIRIIRQVQAPPGQDPPAVNNPDILLMSVNYKNQQGETIDPSILIQGTDFIAEVTVKNPGRRGNYEQMALTQIFPSGWEIINTRLMDNEKAISLSPYTYRDIRDDRVFTYFNIPASASYTYQVLLNASYSGKYYLPAVSCSAMYNNEIQAVLPGKWTEVLPGKNK